MMIDIKKHGFIVTYFKSSPEGEKVLIDLIKTISRTDVYLVLGSHTSDVPLEIQKLCDFYFYQELNIVDNRKYSHGVAENNIIEIALQHLKWKGIQWTYKSCYDVVINDTSRFRDWVLDYKYDFVSCNWGDNFLATHSFFANVDFILENIKFYKSVEEMFSVNTVLENCWQSDIESKNLKHKVYSFKDKADLYGELNKMDVIGYNYHKIDFWYSEDEKRFYTLNAGVDFKGQMKIFDYYSDLCLYRVDNLEHPSGILMWHTAPHQKSVPLSKNGWYVEYYFDNITIRSNYGIKDFTDREPLRKAFGTYRWHPDMKYHEYSELAEFDLYKNEEFNVDLKSIRNYVDVGANFGLGGVYPITNGIKCYLIDPDKNNLSILENAYSKNSKVKIYPYAICDVDGMVDFYVDNDASVVSSLFEINANGMVNNREKITVPAITPNTLIEKWIDEDYIDYMKIDIEGAEYLFFETITDVNIKKIKNMVIEFHNNDNYQVLGILTKLTKNDFKFKLDNWGSYTDNFIIGNNMGIIYAWR
jgi:FkbM family methyltransferase